MFKRIASNLEYAKKMEYLVEYMPGLKAYLQEDDLMLFDLIPKEQKSFYLEEPCFIVSDDVVMIYQSYKTSQIENPLEENFHNRPIYMSFTIFYYIDNKDNISLKKEELFADFNQLRNSLIEPININDQYNEKEMFFSIKNSNDLKNFVSLSLPKRRIKISNIKKKYIIVSIVVIFLMTFMSYYLSDEAEPVEKNSTQSLLLSDLKNLIIKDEICKNISDEELKEIVETYLNQKDKNHQNNTTEAQSLINLMKDHNCNIQSTKAAIEKK